MQSMFKSGASVSRVFKLTGYVAKVNHTNRNFSVLITPNAYFQPKARPAGIWLNGQIPPHQRIEFCSFQQLRPGMTCEFDVMPIGPTDKPALDGRPLGLRILGFKSVEAQHELASCTGEFGVAGRIISKSLHPYNNTRVRLTILARGLKSNHSHPEVPPMYLALDMLKSESENYIPGEDAILRVSVRPSGYTDSRSDTRIYKLVTRVEENALQSSGSDGSEQVQECENFKTVTRAGHWATSKLGNKFYVRPHSVRYRAKK